jgi:hypothetical protein
MATRLWIRCAATGAALVVATSGCGAVPPILGFPHPDPRPAGGPELSLHGFGGGGAIFFHGGGGLSVAGSAGPVGLTGVVWAGVDWWIPAFGADFEVAVPFAASDASEETEAEAEPETEPPGRRHYLLFGIGAGDVFTAHWNREAYGGDHRHRLALSPSLGIQGGPAEGRTGGFWGLRLSVGPVLDVVYRVDREDARIGPVETSCVGTHVTFAGGGGWRWALGDGAAFDFQIVPFVSSYIEGENAESRDRTSWVEGTSVGGAHLMFSFAFDLDG